MEFRPCIDIHNGRVKQIVGSTLRDGDVLRENFVADQDAAFYARLYQKDGLKGGHVILLNAKGTPEYEADLREAFSAFRAFPLGLQAGGGITDENASDFLDAGASHVIVTSFVFTKGQICFDRLERLSRAVGREHIVLDLSCRQRTGEDGMSSPVIVTDRWQTFTDTELTQDLLRELSAYCDEYLVHAVDAEGKAEGIEEDVVRILKDSPIPATYAGGISSPQDINRIRELGGGSVHVTIGSALSLFGGTLDYREVLRCIRS